MIWQLDGIMELGGLKLEASLSNTKPHHAASKGPAVLCVTPQLRPHEAAYFTSCSHWPTVYWALRSHLPVRTQHDTLTTLSSLHCC